MATRRASGSGASSSSDASGAPTRKRKHSPVAMQPRKRRYLTSDTSSAEPAPDASSVDERPPDKEAARRQARARGLPAEYTQRLLAPPPVGEAALAAARRVLGDEKVERLSKIYDGRLSKAELNAKRRAILVEIAVQLAAAIARGDFVLDKQVETDPEPGYPLRRPRAIARCFSAAALIARGVTSIVRINPDDAGLRSLRRVVQFFSLNADVLYQSNPRKCCDFGLIGGAKILAVTHFAMAHAHSTLTTPLDNIARMSTGRCASSASSSEEAADDGSTPAPSSSSSSAAPDDVVVVDRFNVARPDLPAALPMMHIQPDQFAYLSALLQRSAAENPPEPPTPATESVEPPRTAKAAVTAAPQRRARAPCFTSLTRARYDRLLSPLGAPALDAANMAAARAVLSTDGPVDGSVDARTATARALLNGLPPYEHAAYDAPSLAVLLDIIWQFAAVVDGGAFADPEGAHCLYSLAALVERGVSALRHVQIGRTHSHVALQIALRQIVATATVHYTTGFVCADIGELPGVPFAISGLFRAGAST